MQLEHPVTILSDSLTSALQHGFEPERFQRKDWKESTKRKQDVMVPAIRHLEARNLEVVGMFVQMWGSTALGFGGIGGAAMTESYTVILRHENRWAICFGGRLAYCIDKPNLENIHADLKAKSMASVCDARRYGKVVMPRCDTTKW